MKAKQTTGSVAEEVFVPELRVESLTRQALATVRPDREWFRAPATKQIPLAQRLGSVLRF